MQNAVTLTCHGHYARNLWTVLMKSEFRFIRMWAAVIAEGIKGPITNATHASSIPPLPCKAGTGTKLLGVQHYFYDHLGNMGPIPGYEKYDMRPGGLAPFFKTKGVPLLELALAVLQGRNLLLSGGALGEVPRLREQPLAYKSPLP